MRHLLLLSENRSHQIGTPSVSCFCTYKFVCSCPHPLFTTSCFNRSGTFHSFKAKSSTSALDTITFLFSSVLQKMISPSLPWSITLPCLLISSLAFWQGYYQQTQLTLHHLPWKNFLTWLPGIHISGFPTSSRVGPPVSLVGSFSCPQLLNQ